MAHLSPVISDLALILVLAAATTILFKWLKQPVILGYIVAGILAGGHFLDGGVTDMANIDLWAEIGIIFLLFSLGLEFSFRKLISVGGSSFITAVVIIVGMMMTGFTTGRLLGWSSTDSVFLGGMLSMSSTTIIIKAFNDLSLQNKKFTNVVFGVLVVEDLFAIVLMVLLSSLYVQKQFEGIVLVGGVLKLLFFLALWFIVGIYLIPGMLKRLKQYLNPETLLILSLGLCLGMVVIANYAGFSSALGAFIMGSILAETNDMQSIEKVTAPVKDLFGAVFFVSVGMLVDPVLLKEYAWPIFIITLVVIFGQIIYATVGLIISGQTLRTSMQASFSLAQIGEFAFIIAALGISLKVTSQFLYPIAVAVSVITTFLTPFIMKMAEPAYAFIDGHLPAKVKTLLRRYSSGSQTVNNQPQWSMLLKKSLLKISLLSLLLGGVEWLSFTYYKPFILQYVPGFYGYLIVCVTTLILILPLLWALAVRHLDRKLFINLWTDPRFNHGMLVSLIVLRLFLASAFVVAVFIQLYSYRWGVIIGFSTIVLLVLILGRRIKKGFLHFEYQFYNNLRLRSYHGSVIMSAEPEYNMHILTVDISPDSPLVGKTIGTVDVRHNYGITVISALRGSTRINTPGVQFMFMPYDKITIVGNEDDLRSFTLITQTGQSKSSPSPGEEIVMNQLSVNVKSPLIGMTVSQFSMMSQGCCLVIGIERSDGTFVKPLGLVRFAPHDMLWVAGEKKQVDNLMSTISLDRISGNGRRKRKARPTTSAAKA